MKGIGSTVLQSFLSITILFLFTRLMGKKQISQLTFFDYVAGISIGSIAAAFAVDSSINYAEGITGLVIYTIFPIALSYIGLKSYKARKLLDGMPTILIQNGKIVEANLVRTKMNVNDLLEECRLKNAFNIDDVEFAVLETSGRLSVLLKSPSQPATLKDMGLPAAYKGLCTNLVIDGRIIEENLSAVGKDKDWLIRELAGHSTNDVENVLLAYLDTSGKLFVHMKNFNPPLSPLM